MTYHKCNILALIYILVKYVKMFSCPGRLCTSNLRQIKYNRNFDVGYGLSFCLFAMWSPIDLLVCVEVLRPSQPNGIMSSAVSLPNHTFTGQALSSKRLTSIEHILSPENVNIVCLNRQA